MMLTLPASKVSVPLTVVRRTRSRVPPKAIEPAKNTGAPTERTPWQVQVFPDKFVKVTDPLLASVATLKKVPNPLLIDEVLHAFAATIIPEDVL